MEDSVPLPSKVTAGLLTVLATAMHENAVVHGFWDGCNPTDPNAILAKIALVHSELSEAVEEVRVRDPRQVYYEGAKPCGVGVELADAVIRRIFDLCAALKIDIGKLIIEKHHYNVSRPYMHGKRV